MARMPVFTLLLLALAGCSAHRGSGGSYPNQGSPFFSPANPGGRELSGAEWLRDTLYDITMPSRGKPDDYGQPIYGP
jgi:hypothetical protein